MTGLSFDKNKYLLENFEKALNEGYIEIYYQPLVRAANDKVCNEEALTRWDDPQLGIINPDEFIPVLESVNLIHRLDFYVLEQMLIKMKHQQEQGLFVVTHSINISQIDFYSCNLVEEIDRRVEASGISKNLVAIEVHESAVARYNKDILAQLGELQRKGYQIWVDDFGDGDCAPFLFQYFHFDMLKISRNIISQLKSNDASRVIVTEVIRIALALGIEIAAKGVEEQGQVDFLREIGCAKLQGFFFCKPISMEQIFERYRTGTQIGFENPEEIEYFATLSRVSLYDLSFIKNEESYDNSDVQDYFDTLPMAVIEVNHKWARIVRGNQNFRRFVAFNTPSLNKVNRINFEDLGAQFSYTINSIRQCAIDGKRMIIHDKTPTGKFVQIMLQKIAENPVTKVSSVVIVMLSVTEVNFELKQQEAFERMKQEKITYARIAAISGNYLSIYTVDPVTNHFTIYKTDSGFRMEVEPEGEDFFETSVKNVQSVIYKEDFNGFKEVFTKENILKQIEENGFFSHTYRIIVEGKPIYVQLKAGMVEEVDGPQLIFGLINVDRQVRKEIEYANSLSAAEDNAMKDGLTGVKNKKAYDKAEEDLNKLIDSGNADAFAIVVFDLNNLKDINDTMGHQAGDAFIKRGCGIICNVFSHSPVYRVGGDEFVVIAQGTDFEKLDTLLIDIEDINKKNKKNGDVTIAVGASRFDNHKHVEAVFEQADANMYLKKKRMKREMVVINNNYSYRPYNYD